jgi:hypothetical protein
MMLVRLLAMRWFERGIRRNDDLARTYRDWLSAA